MLKSLIIIFCLLNSFVFSAEKLRKYNINANSVTTSGLSSGGAMAMQYHFSWSREVYGAGIFAGGPYLCALQGVGWAAICMETPGLISASALIFEANLLSYTFQIDPVNNIRNSKVYIFHGPIDSVVKLGAGRLIEEIYNNFQAQVVTEFNIQAEHSQPTNGHGGPCHLLNHNSYINDCNYDGAFEALNHLYGGLIRPTNSSLQLSSDIVEFDQGEFFTLPPRTYSMDETGYIYVPQRCKDGHLCKLHIAFHGCLASREMIGDIYVRQAGYIETADLNDIIVMFPQTIKTTLNPNSCWDWWGYTGIYFATKNGFQTFAVKRMQDKLVKG